jgi:UDP-N-acetylglucosamine--N-acetylmuramyl-(pentapeptide) pyrophosphoryl-undecaprenol N-acetylglucosamine transferase
MTVHARTLMVMAGGTGGHIMPGLAVAQDLRARGWNVVWMGHPEGMESRLVPPQGIPLVPLRFSGVRGKGIKTLVKLPFTLLRALGQAFSALGRHKPDVVLGMGGYVALPGGLMAAMRGIPLVLHEQNSVAGMTNKVLARVADQVLTAFPGAFPGKTGGSSGVEQVGNPVRPEMTRVAAPADRLAGRTGPLRLLVVGGSLGAQALNDTVPQALARLPAAARPTVVHQAGEKHLAALQASYANAGVAGDCRAFITDMAAAYADADLVICRSGAMTVAEICSAGAAALFVPFPHAVDDHQTTNAKYLSDAQAGWLKPQSALTPEWLAAWLAERTRPELIETATRARAMARPLATARIADICEAAARKEKP